MGNRRTFQTAVLLVSMLLGLSGAATAGGSVTFQVGVDTTSIAGTGGYLDMIFDAADTSSQLAYASVTNFQTDGTLATSALHDGDASGLLPGTLSLDNGVAAGPPQGFNDVYQALTYGTTLSFDVTLTGPAVDRPDSNGSGSTFSLILYDATGMNTLLTTDTTYGGSVAIIDLDSDGGATPQVFPASTGGVPAASIVASGATPEPSSLILLVAAMPAVWIFRRRVHRV